MSFGKKTGGKEVTTAHEKTRRGATLGKGNKHNLQTIGGAARMAARESRKTNVTSGERENVEILVNQDGVVTDKTSTIDIAVEDELLNKKNKIFIILVEMLDLTALSQFSREEATEEIRDIISEIISLKKIDLTLVEQEKILKEICDDVLGLGPLEDIINDDDVSDIMVNGSANVFVERGGRIYKTKVKFRDNTQLMNVCQRIVSQVGRRVDESSPICDARLLDGSRVNVIAQPCAIDGPSLTIRKFKKDKLTIADMVRFNTISPQAAKVFGIIGRCRINTLISGGTGAGKTTLLNCLSSFIDKSERVITCEDAAELQMQQPHVVRLETRPPNMEGAGEITMRDLVRNCLRMRPERIIVGEVRGPEALDLLQAMNTGHDGSMGTLHANSPREAIKRIESMISMGGYQLAAATVREMIVSSIDIIIQVARLRDGSRRVTHITEVLGFEGDVVTLQDLFRYEIKGEDENGNIMGFHKSSGIMRPGFWDRARYYGLHEKLSEAMSVQ